MKAKVKVVAWLCPCSPDTKQPRTQCSNCSRYRWEVGEPTDPLLLTSTDELRARFEEELCKP